MNGTHTGQHKRVTIDSLVAKITSSSSIVTDFLRDSGHPQPSLDADGPLFPPEAPETVVAARSDVITAARQLGALIAYPIERANEITEYATMMASLHFISHFDIANAVPFEGDISYTDLANKLGLPQTRMTRLIRHEMMNFIFRESRPGYVAHTAMSVAMAKPTYTRFSIASTSENYALPLLKVVEATEVFDGEETRSNAPACLAFNTGGKPFFQWLTRHPWRMKLLQDQMTSSTAASQDLEPVELLSLFDWDSIGNGTVVDVGGGTGSVSRIIAELAPKLQFVVQDLASAVKQGEEECPAELKDRFKFQEHDFFTLNPIKEADIYFLRWICHDWPDVDAATILRSISSAMDPSSRIILWEAVMPLPGEIPFRQERSMRSMDVVMMAMNGVERTREHWDALIERADKHLRINRVFNQPGNMFSLIEIMKK